MSVSIDAADAICHGSATGKLSLTPGGGSGLDYTFSVFYYYYT